MSHTSGMEDSGKRKLCKDFPLSGKRNTKLELSPPFIYSRQKAVTATCIRIFSPLSTLNSFPSLKAFVLSPSILSLAFLQSTSSPILTLHHRWLGTLFYMTFLFVVAVILLNLLIAQFSSTYEDVTEKAKVSVTLNRTKILADMEKLIWTLLVSLMQPSFIPPVVIFVFCNRERVLWLR